MFTPFADSKRKKASLSGRLIQTQAIEAHDQVELFGKPKAPLGPGIELGGGSSWDTATAHDSLNRGTRLLEDSRRILAETEEVCVFP